jgi:iron complex transport system substrate-binding protein
VKRAKRRVIVASAAVLALGAAATLVMNGRREDAGATGRLVSLTPAITETVFALGGGDQLSAVSDYCILPAGSQLPRVGSALTPRFEAIAALRPSHILCDDSAGSKRRELAALGPVEILPWLTLSEVASSTRHIGVVLGKAAAGEELAHRLEARLSQKPPAGAPRVLLLLSYDPDRPAELWFIRRNSLHGAALAAAGGENAVDHDVTGLPRLSVEELIKVDPDVVLIIPSKGSTSAARQAALAAFGKLSPLRAVKNGDVRVVDDASQSTGPSILELVDALARALKK